MIAATLAALGSGLLVGFSLSLVGGGGSILATPLLIYLVGVAPPHVAIGTSALAVSINAMAGLASHARAGHVRWPCALAFAAIGTIGALVGSSLGKLIDGDRLLLLFGLLMLLVGALMLRPRGAQIRPERPVDLATCSLTMAAALAAGVLAGFFGIGGGFLIVPGLMLATGMPIINAVGSSLLAVASFGLATALSYAYSGLLDWRVAAEFVVGGVGGSILGIRLAQHLAGQKGLLNRVFAGMIFLVAAYVIYRSLPLA